MKAATAFLNGLLLMPSQRTGWSIRARLPHLPGLPLGAPDPLAAYYSMGFAGARFDRLFRACGVIGPWRVKRTHSGGHVRDIRGRGWFFWHLVSNRP